MNGSVLRLGCYKLLQVFAFGAIFVTLNNRENERLATNCYKFSIFATMFLYVNILTNYIFRYRSQHKMEVFFGIPSLAWSEHISLQ